LLNVTLKFFQQSYFFLKNNSQIGEKKPNKVNTSTMTSITHLTVTNNTFITGSSITSLTSTSPTTAITTTTKAEDLTTVFS
jgi:hypothetical protein